MSHAASALNGRCFCSGPCYRWRSIIRTGVEGKGLEQTAGRQDGREVQVMCPVAGLHLSWPSVENLKTKEKAGGQACEESSSLTHSVHS